MQNSDFAPRYSTRASFVRSLTSFYRHSNSQSAPSTPSLAQNSTLKNISMSKSPDPSEKQSQLQDSRKRKVRLFNRIHPATLASAVTESKIPQRKGSLLTRIPSSALQQPPLKRDLSRAISTPALHATSTSIAVDTESTKAVSLSANSNLITRNSNTLQPSISIQASSSLSSSLSSSSSSFLDGKRTPPKRPSRSSIPLLSNLPLSSSSAPTSAKQQRPLSMRQSSALPSPPPTPTSNSSSIRKRNSYTYGNTAPTVLPQVARASSRMKHHRRTRGSNTSGFSSSSSITSFQASHYKVDLLKNKIKELQQVLEQDQNERAEEMVTATRISSLQAQLDRERTEKSLLLAKIKILEDGSNTNSNRTSRTSTQSERTLDSAAEDSSSTDRSTVVTSPTPDDWRTSDSKSLQQLDRELARLKSLTNHNPQDSHTHKRTSSTETNFLEHALLQAQQDLTELKLAHEGLKTECASWKYKCNALADQLTQSETQRQQTEAAHSTLVTHSRSTTARLEDDISSLRQDTARLQAQLAQRDAELAAQAKEHSKARDELEMTIARLFRDHEATVQHAQALEAEQSALANTSRAYKKQITGLDRELRRSQTQVTILETNLQDLKISLEEKAMENDELSRSIQRVMEQASSTIVEAKRRKSLTRVPPTAVTHNRNLSASSHSLASLIE